MTPSLIVTDKAMRILRFVSCLDGGRGGRGIEGLDNYFTSDMAANLLFGGFQFVPNGVRGLNS